MIKLTKAPKPEVLEANEGVWRDQYAALREDRAGATKAAATRYRHADIKAQLVEETFGKCIYCESKILHVSPGDIEHILPKSKRPDLIVDWSNLGLACQECNRRKTDYYEPVAPLINPYVDDPADHLVFAGPLVFPRPGDDMGRRTRARLELSRASLVEKRKERLEQIQSLLDLAAKQTNESDRQLLRDELLREIGRESEYSATASTFALSQLTSGQI